MRTIRYTVLPGNHFSKPRIFKLWYGDKKFSFRISIEQGWYGKDDLEHNGISKLVGVSFGTHAEKPLNKIPIIRNLINSVIVGCQPDFSRPNHFNIYIINDNRGVETRPLVYSVKRGEPFDVDIYREDKRARVVINNAIHNIYYMNTIPFGYYLKTYFGGKSPARYKFTSKIVYKLWKKR